MLLSTQSALSCKTPSDCLCKEEMRPCREQLLENLSYDHREDITSVATQSLSFCPDEFCGRGCFTGWAPPLWQSWASLRLISPSNIHYFGYVFLRMFGIVLNSKRCLVVLSDISASSHACVISDTLGSHFSSAKDLNEHCRYTLLPQTQSGNKLRSLPRTKLNFYSCSRCICATTSSM